MKRKNYHWTYLRSQEVQGRRAYRLIRFVLNYLDKCFAEDYTGRTINPDIV